MEPWITLSSTEPSPPKRHETIKIVSAKHWHDKDRLFFNKAGLLRNKAGLLSIKGPLLENKAGLFRKEKRLYFWLQSLFIYRTSNVLLFQQVLPDITTEILAFKVNLASFGEGLDEGFVLGVAIGADRNDTTTCRDHLSILEGCTSMEHH